MLISKLKKIDSSLNQDSTNIFVALNEAGK